MFLGRGPSARFSSLRSAAVAALSLIQDLICIARHQLSPDLKAYL